MNSKSSISQVSTVSTRTVGMLAAGLWLAALITPSARADFNEAESNDTKATANAFGFGTATSATISGTSATTADSDYFKITTAYTTPGFYVNTLTLNNTTGFIGSIRGLSQTTGAINAGTDVVFQSTVTSGTASPFGVNQFYSAGGAGKSQSLYYKVVAATGGGGAYTSTFASTLITPTALAPTFNAGTINFNAQANVGSSGVATNTEIVIFDSARNVYYDNVTGSPTFGLVANNDTNGSFALSRNFGRGTYYIAIGISNVATGDAAASDDPIKSNAVLDFANVIATNNQFYNGNNGNTRPSDFTITDGAGTTYSSAGQVIGSLYSLNFYSFTVVPEPGEVACYLAGGLCVLALGRRFLAVRKAASA